MRVVAVHEDVLVCTSAIWQTSCAVVRSGDEVFLVDSPILPEELEALPALLESVSWTCSGLLATHGDWDHLLGRMAFPGAALGVAETTAARLTGSPGDAQRKLRAFDEEHYIERGPLQLGQIQSLPVPGRLDVGDAGAELELHPADGHVEDGMAIWVPWARVLLCGDFLSPVEIPMLSAGGSRSAYIATLERLRPLVDAADHVVPGHGGHIDGVRAAAILREDLEYLRTGDLPLARRNAGQREIDAENRERW